MEVRQDWALGEKGPQYTGPAYKEFSYNEHLATTSKFLC